MPTTIRLATEDHGMLRVDLGFDEVLAELEKATDDTRLARFATLAGKRVALNPRQVTQVAEEQ